MVDCCDGANAAGSGLVPGANGAARPQIFAKCSQVLPRMFVTYCRTILLSFQCFGAIWGRFGLVTSCICAEKAQ
jgi:hypothetical protein